jgi:polysaccharide pyruvyl transferase WcaK-like protein
MDTDTHILGYFGNNNAGDDAFADFWHRRIGIPCDRIRADLSSHAPIRNVILGGGAVINNYFIQRLPRAFDQLHLIGVSFPYGDEDLDILASVRSRIGRVVLRSKRDFELALSRGLDQAEYAPDLVFGHTFHPAHVKYIEHLNQYAALPISNPLKEKNLLILLSGDYYFSDSSAHFFECELFKARLATALDELAQYYNLIFLPFSVWHSARDYIFAGEVIMKMKMRESCLLVDRYLGPDALFSVIKHLEGFVISMKYHGLIFAAHAGIPFLNIGKARKNIHFCKDEDVSSLSVPVDQFNIEDFLLAVKRAEDPALRPMIQEIAQRNWQYVNSLAYSIRGAFS